MRDHITNETIGRAAAGDLRAFEDIYKEYSGFVYNVGLRVMNNHADAQEVTQDVFLSVYRKLSGFREMASLKTWLYRIAVNTAINHIKKESKLREKAAKLKDEADLLTLENKEQGRQDREYGKEIVTGILMKLNPKQRACIVLKHIEGFTCNEISNTLKININTVKTHLRRAREAILAMGKDVIKSGL